MLGKRPRSLRVIDPPIATRRYLPLANDVRSSDREAVPNYVVWELTLKCDLSCRHCGSRAGKARKDELTTEEALRVVSELAKMGTKEITLIGGEAYLHEGWTQVARAIVDAGMLIGVLTGGYGMTRERLLEAQSSGISRLSVSVDALEPLHDALRGKRGSYREATRTLREARDLGFSTSFNTQISRPALHEIEPMVEQVLELGVSAWQVSMTVPMGRAADEPNLLLEPYQVLEVMPMLARLHARMGARGVRIDPGNDIGYFGPYESLLRAGDPNGHRMACSAGKFGMGIEADGSIKGCPSLPSRDYVGGNVRDASLKDIWERAEPLRFTRERDASALWGYCATCYYKDACLGGCSWTAHVIFGKRGNNPYCHHRALELLREGKRERIRQVQPAPGEPFDFGRFDCFVEDFPEDELVRARAIAETGEGFIHGGASR